MIENSEIPARRRSLRIRLGASFLIWLAVALLLGVGWLFAWMLPSRGEFELRGADLPEPAETRSATGIVIDDGHYLSRRQAYYRPRARFSADGRDYEVEATGGYAPQALVSIPVRGSETEIVYHPSDPARAWFKWEYERMRSDHASWSAGRVGDAIRANYKTAASIAAAALGLVLLINLFVPVLRPFRAFVKTRRLGF